MCALCSYSCCLSSVPSFCYSQCVRVRVCVCVCGCGCVCVISDTKDMGRPAGLENQIVHSVFFVLAAVLTTGEFQFMLLGRVNFACSL